MLRNLAALAGLRLGYLGKTIDRDGATAKGST
jgi:hypothetical protein